MVSIMRKRSQSVSVGMCLSVRVSRKRRQASIPSLCGMLVYNDKTSRVTSMALFGRVARFASLLRTSVVSLMCESKEATRGLM